jgi:hypothetical protein
MMSDACRALFFFTVQDRGGVERFRQGQSHRESNRYLLQRPANVHPRMEILSQAG